jgi:hypothetical protein
MSLILNIPSWYPRLISLISSNNRALSKLDIGENNINAKGKSALKRTAGVGVFWSR